MKQFKPKKKYEPPKMTVKKLTPFFFACRKATGQVCATVPPTDKASGTCLS